MLTLATSLLFISQVSAGLIGDATHLLRREDAMEHKMKRYVDSIIEPMQKRQSATGNGMVNVTAWDAQTAAACSTELSALNGVAIIHDRCAHRRICQHCEFECSSGSVVQWSNGFRCQRVVVKGKIRCDFFDLVAKG